MFEFEFELPEKSDDGEDDDEYELTIKLLLTELCVCLGERRWSEGDPARIRLQLDIFEFKQFVFCVCVVVCGDVEVSKDKFLLLAFEFVCGVTKSDCQFIIYEKVCFIRIYCFIYLFFYENLNLK